MTDQIDIEELIDANIQNNLEGENNIETFKTNVPPKWNLSLDDNDYKLIGSNGYEFKHDDVRNIKLFEDVGTVEPLPLVPAIIIILSAILFIPKRLNTDLILSILKSMFAG